MYLSKSNPQRLRLPQLICLNVENVADEHWGLDADGTESVWADVHQVLQDRTSLGLPIKTLALYGRQVPASSEEIALADANGCLLASMLVEFMQDKRIA